MAWFARTAAVLGAFALVAATFLPWQASGAVPLDLPVALAWREGAGSGQPTVGTVLVALAAVPAVAALVGDRAWPRLLAAVIASALALTWVAAVPDAGLHAGIVVTLAAGGALLVAAASATGRTAPRTPPPAPDRGYRFVDHTADVAFEAWGPTRADCFEQGVGALVASFTDVPPRDHAADEVWPLYLAAAADEDLLVDLLSEVIYLVDARDAVPAAVELRDRPGGGLTGRFLLAPVADVTVRGAVPKAVTYHGLEVDAGADGWTCRVTIDV